MASKTAILTKQLTPLPGLKSMWEDSQDMPCGTLGTFYECWTVKGLAREVFHNIADGIKLILESSADELEEARQGPPYPLGWTMYMIKYRGLPTPAHPTLVLECTDRTVRFTAKMIIGRHQIWRDAVLAYPGLKLAHSARGPQLCAGVGDTPAFVGRSSKSPQMKEVGRSMFKLDVIPAYLPARQEEWVSLKGDTEIHRQTRVKNPCGAPIHIFVNSFTTLTREATLGGVVFINGQTYGLTVAHAFTSSMQPPEISTESEIDDSFCFDDDDDEGRSEVDPIAVSYAANEETSFRTTHHKVPRADSSASSLMPTVYNITSSASYFTLRGGSRTNLGRLCMASTGRGEGPDWAVISIEDGQYRKPNVIMTPDVYIVITKIASDSPKNMKVLAVAPRGLISGSISGTPYYLGNSENRCFEKCWMARLLAPICKYQIGSVRSQLTGNNSYRRLWLLGYR